MAQEIASAGSSQPADRARWPFSLGGRSSRLDTFAGIAPATFIIAQFIGPSLQSLPRIAVAEAAEFLFMIERSEAELLHCLVFS
jgi:hypothetical protein